MFAEFALLLIISAAAGAVSLWLRQPLLIAYIAVGVVAGPAVLGLVTAHEQIELLAQVGVAILLFVVGLRLDLHHVRHIGPVALATGLGQLAFTILFGFFIVLGLGRTPVEALYVAVALTFSSTIIIVKLLSDKRELDTLHGRIAVGFLIVQDLAVVLAMLVMSALREAGDTVAASELAVSLMFRIGLAVAALVLLMRWVLPWLVARIARSQELLLVFAIAWGTGLAALGEWTGFSKEAGAFLAGFSLASTPYREAIGGRLAAVRDVFLLFFFVHLGAGLELATLGEEVVPALLLSLFVLVGNPLIVMLIMGYMGYRRRTGFMAGLTVAQISEFSIIFVAMGISLGHIGAGALGLTTLVGIITITLSTYMILYAGGLYERLSPWLAWFERRHPHRELRADAAPRSSPPEVMVFGLGRYGSRLALGLRDAGLRVAGVDFDPEVVGRLRHAGIDVRFGDSLEADFLDSLVLADVPLVVLALPDASLASRQLEVLRDHGFRGEVALLARHPGDEDLCNGMDAGIVLHVVNDAVDRAVGLLADRIHRTAHAR